MTDAPAPPTVSLSRPLGSETPRHTPLRRDSVETARETADLKALARLVLTRDSRRDTERDRLSRPPLQIADSAETVAADETTLATWGKAEEKRAAIVEQDGLIPHAWAEGFARLDPDRPPGDVPPRRWQRFVDDAGCFLDSSFCAVAVALGWGSLDLFGCDRERPFARIDQAGLTWLLNGAALVMLTKDAATIETQTGARQTFRRKSAEPGRVLAWELAQ